jgi:hypothetical protein
MSWIRNTAYNNNVDDPDPYLWHLKLANRLRVYNHVNKWCEVGRSSVADP